MRYGRHAPWALALVMLTAARADADDKAARELLEKAIRAQGGEAVLTKFAAGTLKMKGTIHALGNPVDFTADVILQGGDQYKAVVDLEIAGQKVHVARVLNRDKGWVQINDQTMDQEGEDLAELKEEAFSEYISALVPLKSPAFTLSIVGESNVDGRAAMGITASCKDHRDINFYFDKESGLLLKSERRTKDETTQQEVTEETFMSDYKEVQGFKQATKFVIKHDGKPFVEAELSDQQLVEKLDDSVFAKP